MNHLPRAAPRLLPWLVANGPVAGPSVAYLPAPRCPFLGPGIKTARRPRLDARNQASANLQRSCQSNSG